MTGARREWSAVSDVHHAECEEMNDIAHTTTLLDAETAVQKWHGVRTSLRRSSITLTFCRSKDFSLLFGLTRQSIDLVVYSAMTWYYEIL